jgi:hypothetical protein
MCTKLPLRYASGLAFSSRKNLFDDPLKPVFVQDADRNHAYRLAIDAVVQEDDLVVDIGTG